MALNAAPPDDTAPTPPGPRMAHVLAVLVAVVALVHRPLFSGRAIYARDLMRWILPARALLRESLARHALPVWNPWEGIGLSVLSDPLHGVFYPPAVVTLAAPLVPSTMAFLLAHVIWGGVGCVLLARHCGARPAGTLVAGLAWSLSGFIASEWISGIRLVSSAWVPWSALCWMIVATRARDRAPGWMASAPLAALPAGAVFLAGEVFLATVIAGFGALVGLGSLVWPAEATHVVHANRSPALGRFARVAVLALALAPVCGAVALLPAARAAAVTQRAAPLPRHLAERVSLRPSRLVEFVAPGALGGAYEQSLTGDAARYFPVPPLAFSVYLGASVLALASLGVSRRRRQSVFLASLAAVSVLVAMGPATPLHGILRTLVPPLAYMRSPEKYLTLAVPLVAVLAGLGVDRITTETPGGPVLRRWALPVALAVLACAARWIYPPGVAGWVSTGALHGLLAAGCVAALPIVARRSSARAAALAVAIVALDLGVHVTQFHHYVPSEGLVAVPPIASVIRADAAAFSPAPPRVFRAPSLDDALDGEVETPTRLVALRSLQENTSVAMGIAILPGYDAAIPQGLQDLLHTGRRDALRLLSVDHALLSVPPGTPPTATRPGFVTVAAPFARVRLYRIENPLPRAYLAGSMARVAPGQLPLGVLQPEVLDGRVALVSDAASLPGLSAPTSRVDCVTERYAPGDVTVRCTADRPRLAVLVEQAAPGWHATVDGLTATWVTTNLVACGVPIPPGTHRIRLQFHPPGLAAGVMASLVGWLVVCVAGVASWRRRAPAASPQPEVHRIHPP